MGEKYADSLLVPMPEEPEHVKVEFVQMSMEDRRKTLLPGQVATGLDPHTGKVISRVVGRVPNDSSTRQQRRAADRRK